MIAKKHKKIGKNQPKIQLKLPEINPRRHVQGAKKNPLLIPRLPEINSIPNNKNILINKENHSLNLIHRRNSFDEEIKARLIEVQQADKMVKNILGAPEATVNIGGDMTNFQIKVQANKDFLKRQRKRSHFQQHNPNIPSEKRHQNPTSPKYKSVSSKDLFPNPHKIISSMKLKIHQNHEVQTARQVKNQKDHLNQEANKKRFKSQRKPINHQKKSKDENSQVFKSIKQILSNPQKNFDVEATKVKKLVKFTIQELENRLKKMNNIEGNKSCFQGINKKNDKNSFDRKLSSAKSVGMIPVSALPVIDDQTYKNWNKIQITQQKEDDGQNINKVIKYHKSNFNQQVDQIQKLEMKSYKSIQKMVQNRKLLLDLQLMKKNKSSVLTIQRKNKEISE